MRMAKAVDVEDGGCSGWRLQQRDWLARWHLVREHPRVAWLQQRQRSLTLVVTAWQQGDNPGNDDGSRSVGKVLASCNDDSDGKMAMERMTTSWRLRRRDHDNTAR